MVDIGERNVLSPKLKKDSNMNTVTTSRRGNIIDVMVNGRFKGTVTYVEGKGYSDGFEFFSAEHFAVYSVEKR
jgi:hypothetical protein